MAVRLVALGPAVYYDKVLSETGQNLITFLIAWGPTCLIAAGPHPRRQLLSAFAIRNGSRLSRADARGP